jgi:hypothetical protein
MPTDLSGDYDPQDQSEVYDEDNQLLDGEGEIDLERRAFEELPDVYDVTTAAGDRDDDEALIGEDLDDDDIIDLEADAGMADIEDDELSARMPEAFDDDALEDEDAEEVAYDGERNLERRGDTGLNLSGDEYDDENDAEKRGDEVRLDYADDLDNLRARHGAAQRLEASHELSDDDLEDLGYRDENGPK